MEDRTRSNMVITGVVWTVTWGALWLIGLGGGGTYLLYEIPGLIFIGFSLYNWRDIKDSTRNSLLITGIIWIVVWAILWLIGTGKSWAYLLHVIPGLILIWFALYNWGSGPDLRHRQNAPLENEGSTIQY